MKWRMGMNLADMRLFAELSPGERPREGLAGAHLPPRGFYRVKTVSRDQLQAANATRSMTMVSKPWFWSRLHHPTSDSTPEPDQQAGRHELNLPQAPTEAAPLQQDMSEAATGDVRIAVRDS